jgi:DNA-binding transcriptional MerR regulator
MTTTEIQKMFVTIPELLLLLGTSKQNLSNWRQKGLITEPERRGRLVFDLDVVRADVARNRLKVSQLFLDTF